MKTSPILNLDPSKGVIVPSEYFEPHWYAAYTIANHEKRVRGQLEERSVESFLPVYESVRHWKDRRMRLQIPLFAGYVFLRMALVDRLRVLQVPSIVRLVGFNGRLSALPDEEIEGLKKGLASGIRVEPHPFLTAGRRVRITAGPFEGREGILIRRRGNLRVILSVQLILRSVAVDVDIADVQPLSFHDGRESRAMV
jgi:transcription antitermination factor NusG